MSGAMRQAELMMAAEEDRYQPPSDGKLEEAQVKEFIRVKSRANDVMEEKSERMRQLAERAERKEQMSMREMSEMMAAGTQMMGMNTIQIEVVKSSGGNWAEHVWVGDALRTAYLQRDVNETAKHNFGLYQQYEDQLQAFVAR